MNSVTLIGDVHGKYRRYHEIIRERDRHPNTIQLGDFGFDYGTLKNVDPAHHVFIGGNHDNYDEVANVPNYLGDFGYMVNFHGIDFFYYRGAYSIDRKYRTVGVNWWQDEQIKIDRFFEARQLYRNTKPEIMITHDCPQEIASLILPPGSHIFENMTGWALQELFTIHQPKVWYFGHYHKSWSMTINGTLFRCLNELEVDRLG